MYNDFIPECWLIVILFNIPRWSIITTSSSFSSSPLWIFYINSVGHICWSMVAVNLFNKKKYQIIWQMYDNVWMEYCMYFLHKFIDLWMLQSWSILITSDFPFECVCVCVWKIVFNFKTFFMFYVFWSCCSSICVLCWYMEFMIFFPSGLYPYPTAFLMKHFPLKSLFFRQLWYHISVN